MNKRCLGRTRPYCPALIVLLSLLISLVLSPSLLQAENYPYTDLIVTIDREHRLLKGKSVTIFSGAGDRKISVGNLTIISVEWDGERINPRIRDGTIALPAGAGGELSIEFECACKESGPCALSDKGLLLTGGWHPAVNGLAHYRLRSSLPSQWTAVSEAEEIAVQTEGSLKLSSFEFPYPRKSVSLIAADYRGEKKQVGGVEISLYSLSGSTVFSIKYAKQAERFLLMHSGTLGAFPYRRLSVVESPFPSSLPAPTMILIGQDPLPFTRAESSLGREVFRQWLGNAVYVDSEKGNWSEGLATYMHDHRLAEQDNRGWQYRKQLLVDYETHVTPDTETALRDFRIVTGPASEAVGSGKSAMVFHMLRRSVGDETFFRVLRALSQERRFTLTSWDDIRTAFAREAGATLGQFTEQWVSGKGTPKITVRNREIRITGTGSLLLFEVSADDGDRQYILDLPVSVTTDRGEINTVIKVSEENSRFETATEGDPEMLVLDMNYDLFRKLHDDEVPPWIGRLLSQGKGTLILPEDSTRIPPYAGLIRVFTQRGYNIREWKEVKDEDLRKSPSLLIGHDNPALSRFFGKKMAPVAGFLLAIRKNPLNPSQVIGIADTDSEQAADAAANELLQYQSHSSVRFNQGGTVTEFSAGESRRGLQLQLRDPVIGIELPKPVTLNDIIDRLALRRIIFVGELHEKYQHHRVQLEVIRALWKKNPEIVIGMEMFRKPFQKNLDDFISSSIDEREFLRSSEYFKQWGFDYNLYRDILRFARDKKIPVVSLNIRKELTAKVSKGGIDSLTEEERKELPKSMDMTDDGYKNRLREIFGQHGSVEGRNFDNFYQAQIIWDEIMAQSIDEYLMKNPGRQMVVIAGAGHLMYSSGIPKRSFRRNQLDYAVILNDETAEPGIADFIFYPREAEYLPAPKLMALLKEEEGKVRITGFPDQSVSEKAGLEKDDIIISLNGEKVTSVQDIQIFLYDKRKGDSIIVRVMRKRFLFGTSERDFQVRL